MAKNNGYLHITVISFENGFALCDIGHNQKVTIAKRYIPKSAHEGDQLIVELMTPAQEIARKKNLAGALLDEILKGR